MMYEFINLNLGASTFSFKKINHDKGFELILRMYSIYYVCV